MTDFTITFEHPLLMLLIIPAFALTILTYFLVAKRLRKTRNRIVSMVLHMIVMTLCISVLAGMKFEYILPNEENEIILLVDVSDTTASAEETRDEFMRTVIDESRYDGYKVGVVTFGFTQQYAVPLTYDTDSIFAAYKSAPLPDTSATDIAAALRYAGGLFEHKSSSKIVLLSDGKETDESAASVIRSVTAQGTRVDTVCLGAGYDSDTVQVVGVQFPNYHIDVGAECSVGVEITSPAGARSAVIEIYDNGDFDSTTDQKTVDVSAGTQVVDFRKTFQKDGLHEICVKVTEADDRRIENNSYYTYLNLQVYDQVLVVDRGADTTESDALMELLKENEFDPTLLHLTDEKVPSTIEELLSYDEIVLNNISNEDLTAYGWPELLYTYVYDYGGGLFTAGGQDEDGNAHAYNRFDLKNTLYQQILPVQAINYTPPLGVAIIIDVSGSMSDNDKLEWAKSAATDALGALTERDYVGIFSLSTNYQTELQLTSRTEETVIKEAINRLTIKGSTQFTPSIVRAGQALIAEKRVDKRHIIIVTDGMPTDKDTDYLPEARRLYDEHGITLSVIGVDISPDSSPTSAAGKMEALVAAGHGKPYYTNDEHELISALQSDLSAPEIKELEERDFHPVVANELSPIFSEVEFGTVKDEDEEGNVIKETPRALSTTLGGFYGVKARERADVLLVGEYEVPIYAQWKFGNGMVGSFMCDLNGDASGWSASFLQDANARKLVSNMLTNLLPTSAIRPNPIRVELEEENYYNHLNIFTTLTEGQRIEGTIAVVGDGGESISLNQKSEGEIGGQDIFITTDLNPENRFTRSVFILKKSGTYRITVSKLDADGTVLATAELYKSFSYSAEYADEDRETVFDEGAFMQDLAEKGGGEAVAPDDPWSVFRDFITGEQHIIDPALAFMIVSAVLFLADIAVRKFKFKWLHEIVRERRERRANKGE